VAEEVNKLKQELEELKKELEKLKKPAENQQKQHNHNFITKENSVICQDCGEKYVKVSNFLDKMTLLKEPHDGLPFLDCPGCRPYFVKTLNDLGYQVLDKGKELIIRKKK